MAAPDDHFDRFGDYVYRLGYFSYRLCIACAHLTSR
jgi:hypothetical protein